MFDNSWITQIEPNILSYIAYGLDEKFPELFCTSENEIVTDDSQFPSLYLRLLSFVERGNDLSGDTINAGLATIQTDVFSLSQEECRAIAVEAMSLMKSLRFDMISAPIYIREGNYYRATSRYRRMIGSGDFDIVSQGG